MKRLVAVVTAAILGISLAGLDGASASSGVRATASYTPSLTFTPCGDGDQCAMFDVPLDWANEDGAKIKLAVRMHPATGASKGILLANPGGPGGSGTFLADSLAEGIPGGVGDQYDVIGWDPRGVGGSRPALRCVPGYFGVNRPNFVPRTKRLMRYWKKKTRAYAAHCGASTAKALLPHMTTLDNVKDMEALRAAIAANGNPGGIYAKLNFYGFSYGTYLGQVYATTFPTKVGRFVFDGVVDPTNYWYGANLKQEVGFDRNLNIFFKWVARHPRAYHLGRDWRAIRHGFNRLLRKLDRHPAYHGKLGPDELTDAMLMAGYYVYYWQFIATSYSDLVRHGRGAGIFQVYRWLNPRDDNGYAVYAGVQCTDALRPPWRTQVRDAWRIHRKRPFLAWDNTWFNAPCVTWPAPSHSRISVKRAPAEASGGRVLLVNETRDAATPYSGALRVRALFPQSALIAGVGGITHAGSLSGISCVDNRIAAFLGSGTLPTRLSGTRADVSCPKVPVPSMRTASMRSTSPLRPGLLAAQGSWLR